MISCFAVLQLGLSHCMARSFILCWKGRFIYIYERSKVWSFMKFIQCWKGRCIYIYKEAWHEALFHVEKVGLSKSIKEAHVFIQENRSSVICPAAYQNLMVIYWRLNCMCVVPLPGWWFDDDFLYSTGSRIG